MREMVERLLELVPRGPTVLARVVGTSGPGPREPGAAMTLGPDGTVFGSLSGGCVEAAVVAAAQPVIAGGPATLERFGYVREDAVEVGLPCGGELRVFVERVDSSRLPVLERLRRALAAGEPVVLATTLDADAAWSVLDDGEPGGEPGDGLRREAAALLAEGRSAIAAAAPVFLHVAPAPPRMIVSGANDFAYALTGVGGRLGYRVTLVDARAAFAQPARFPAAHEVVVDWPHRYLAAEQAAGRIDARTVVCVLGHDAKFDVPMLRTALTLPGVGFVGALASRRTHAARLARLREDGLDEATLARLHSPLGLDLNARTPEETAISIVAQILAERSGATGRALDRMSGPIHR
ncbi:XdhC family protein [Nocardia farcinica]|nr:XdhC/CoxI family protein [Nocardia farcinica]MBF6444229.1 XdhC family protein [Nocardia farcinica]